MGFFKDIASWISDLTSEAAAWRKGMKNGTDYVTKNYGKDLFNITTILPDRELFPSKKNKKATKK